MEPYKKPTIASGRISVLIPALMLSPVPVFISPVAPVIAGAAAVAAVFSKKGNGIIDSTHTSALTARKNFALG